MGSEAVLHLRLLLVVAQLCSGVDLIAFGEVQSALCGLGRESITYSTWGRKVNRELTGWTGFSGPHTVASPDNPLSGRQFSLFTVSVGLLALSHLP